MRDVYFVMRGLARVSTVCAVLWSVGWVVDALSGGAISGTQGTAFEGALLLGVVGAGTILGTVMAVATLHHFGELGSDDDDEIEGPPQGMEIPPPAQFTSVTPPKRQP